MLASRLHGKARLAGSAMSGLRNLLGGRQPLDRALWVYALLYGTLLNLAATFAALAAVAADLPPAVAFLLYVLPVPYVVGAVIGVWRSAARAPAGRAGGARLLAVVWGLLMLLL